VNIVDWRIFEVRQAGHADRTRHLVGSLWPLYDGQVSSAIMAFDAHARTVVTASGNRYELQGDGTGIGQNAAYTWDLWRSRCGATNVVDVTAEYLAMLSNQEHK